MEGYRVIPGCQAHQQVIWQIFIAPFVSVVRDQLLVESIIIIGSYKMMKKFANTQKNGGTW